MLRGWFFFFFFLPPNPILLNKILAPVPHVPVESIKQNNKKTHPNLADILKNWHKKNCYGNLYNPPKTKKKIGGGAEKKSQNKGKLRHSNPEYVCFRLHTSVCTQFSYDTNRERLSRETVGVNCLLKEKSLVTCLSCLVPPDKNSC